MVRQCARDGSCPWTAWRKSRRRPTGPRTPDRRQLATAAAAVPPAAGWTCPTSSTRRRASRSQSHVVGPAKPFPVGAADADRGQDLGLLAYLVRVGEQAPGRLSVRPEQPALQAVEHRVDGGLADLVAVPAQLPRQLSSSEPVLALQRTRQRVRTPLMSEGTSPRRPLARNPSSVATHLGAGAHVRACCRGATQALGPGR
jgi:hypothetical protein